MRSRLSDKTGAAIRRLRLARGWSLAQLSETSGVPISTLSRVELGQNALNYDKLIRLCRALDVDLENLVAKQAERAPASATGRRAVDRAGAGQPLRLGPHAARMLAGELIGRALTPLIIEIGPDGGDRMESLPGEAWLTLLDGDAVMTTPHYAPLNLGAGDSVYFDAAAGFALSSKARARALLVLAGETGSTT